jgi:deazaflavin-dependent oxidoreductase (nitroreductase family)
MPFVLKMLVAFHIALYRASAGRLGSWGGVLLLLTTTGRRTGVERTVPLRFIRDEAGNPVITASMGGAPKNPAWFENLSAKPEVSYQIGDQQFRARAEIAPPELRAKLWKQLTAVAPNFLDYEKKTTRVIPMVVLKPA